MIGGSLLTEGWVPWFGVRMELLFSKTNLKAAIESRLLRSVNVSWSTGIGRLVKGGVSVWEPGEELPLSLSSLLGGVFSVLASLEC